MNSDALESAEPILEEAPPVTSYVGDSMGDYLKLIGKLVQDGMLDEKEEKCLAREAHKGDLAAKWKLVESNLKLVVSVAKVYARSGVPLPDLIQEGNIGLMKAVDSFNPDKGFKFGTYAVPKIKREIRQAIEHQGRAIRVPSYAIQLIRGLSKAKSFFVTEKGCEPTVEELCERTQLSREKVMRLLEASEALVSLDEGAREDGATSLLERLVDSEASNPEADAMERESLEVLGQLLTWLSPQEKMIIKKRFGLTDGVTSTLQEIGQQLHITRERVRQLEAKALRKLKIAVIRNRLETYFEA